MEPLYWQYVGIFASALAAVLLVLALWGRREDRRTIASKLAVKCAEWGLTQLSRLFMAYAIGNYIGKDSVTRVLHEIIDELQDGGLEAMLRKVGWKVVEGVFLKNDADRSKLQTLVAASAKAVSPETVTPPAQTV